MKIIFEKDFSPETMSRYMDRVVSKIFKILPMKECGDTTTDIYIISLIHELVGGDWVFDGFGNDADYISVISILKWMIAEDRCVDEIRREVFNCISICKRMKIRFMQRGVCDERC